MSNMKKIFLTPTKLIILVKYPLFLLKAKRLSIEHIRLTNNQIKQTQTYWKLHQKTKQSKKFNEYFNTALYCSITLRDISILYMDYITTKNKSKQNLYSRLLSMTIIEFLEDINFLLGKNLKQEFESNELKEFIPELNNINKKFALLKKENNKELRIIRNNASAHKTKDSLKLINLTDKTHVKEIEKITSNIFIIQIELYHLMREIEKRIAYLDLR